MRMREFSGTKENVEIDVLQIGHCTVPATVLLLLLLIFISFYMEKSIGHKESPHHGLYHRHERNSLQ